MSVTGLQQEATQFLNKLNYTKFLKTSTLYIEATFLRNVVNHLQNYTTSQSKRSQCEFKLSELHIFFKNNTAEAFIPQLKTVTATCERDSNLSRLNRGVSSASEHTGCLLMLCFN